MKQNKKVVISHKMCQLHWRAAGLIVGHSELSTESVGHQTVKVQSARSYPKWNARSKTQLHENIGKKGQY
jgi:hypothetical protein